MGAARLPTMPWTGKWAHGCHAMLLFLGCAGSVSAFVPARRSGQLHSTVSRAALRSRAVHYRRDGASRTGLKRPVEARGLSKLSMQEAKFGKKTTAKEVLDYYQTDLSGKTAIVTGANSGIGLETVKALASVGCRVIMACRNVDDGRTKIDKEIAQPGEGGYVVAEPEIEVRELDLSDLMSVERFARGMQDEQIDLLVNNAGIMALPSKEVTVQGFEKQIGVNHFGHFHLTNLLLPGMQAQGSPARIVTLSSVAHESFGEFDVDDLHYSAGRRYSAWGAYGQSKLANLLFTKALHSRLVAQRDCQISSLAVHPGVIRTALWRERAGSQPDQLAGSVARNRGPDSRGYAGSGDRRRRCGFQRRSRSLAQSSYTVADVYRIRGCQSV